MVVDIKLTGTLLLPVSSQAGLNFSGPIPVVQEVLGDFLASNSLHRLSLASCRLFDASCITLLSACCPALRYLDLRANPVINLASISDLALGCGASLETLILSSCVRIDDACVDVLARLCGRLACLDVSSNANISDKSLESIGKIRTIREISVARCTRVGGAGIGNLVRRYFIYRKSFLTVPGAVKRSATLISASAIACRMIPSTRLEVAFRECGLMRD